MKTIPQSVYRKHLLRAQDAGNFFIFRRDYVTSGLLTKTEALFFQDLINKGSMKNVKKDEDDFFFCSIRYLWRSLRWDYDSQKYLFRKLKKKGFVETKRVGKKRYIRINVEEVELALDLAIKKAKANNRGKNTPASKKQRIGGKIPPYIGGKIPPDDPRIGGKILTKNKDNYKRKEKNHVSGSAGNGERSSFHLNGESHFFKSPIPTFGKEMAILVYEELSKVRKIMRKMKSLDQWARKFTELVAWIMKRDKSAKEEAQAKIREDLKFHFLHLKEHFHPKLYSATSICDDYIRLEDAIDRFNEPKKSREQLQDQNGYVNGDLPARLRW